ncbi:hypothetical protein [Streptococcus pneumoniae]|nr:hypothetical protein [Streptococcus pneumoniae]
MKRRSQLKTCSKHSFEVVDETDEVSNPTYGKATLTCVLRLWIELKICF